MPNLPASVLEEDQIRICGVITALYANETFDPVFSARCGFNGILQGAK
jgi:hypothetical protein